MHSNAIVLAVTLFAMGNGVQADTYINGVCNSYTQSPVKFFYYRDGQMKHQNEFSQGNSIWASFAIAEYWDWIPIAGNPNDFLGNRLVIQSADKLINYAIWDDGDGKIMIGPNFANSRVLTDSNKLQCGGDCRWNVVIGGDGSVTLYLTADPHDCSTCTTIKGVQGDWQVIGTSSGSQTFKWLSGVKRGSSVTDTKSWSWSVTRSISAGFEAGGASMSSSFSATIGQEFSHSYTTTFEASESTEIDAGPFPAGTVWQWQWSISDLCGESAAGRKDTFETTSEDIKPCCLPGYFAAGNVWNKCTVDAAVLPHCRQEQQHLEKLGESNSTSKIDTPKGIGFDNLQAGPDSPTTILV